MYLSTWVYCKLHNEKTKYGGSSLAESEKALLQDSQARRQEDKSQLRLPKGKGTGLFIGLGIRRQGRVRHGEHGER